MKSADFNQNFEIDRTARGVKASPRSAIVEKPEALTADGKPFSYSAIYHFFDGEAVRTSEGLRRIDLENIGSPGCRVVRIDRLRETRDAALEDAQKAFVKKIEDLRDKVREFEEQKTPANRTMKFVLSCRG
jgi:hypothetical protein